MRPTEQHVIQQIADSLQKTNPILERICFVKTLQLPLNKTWTLPNICIANWITRFPLCLLWSCLIMERRYSIRALPRLFSDRTSEKHKGSFTQANLINFLKYTIALPTSCNGVYNDTGDGKRIFSRLEQCNKLHFLLFLCEMISSLWFAVLEIRCPTISLNTAAFRYWERQTGSRKERQTHRARQEFIGKVIRVEIK